MQVTVTVAVLLQYIYTFSFLTYTDEQNEK